MERVGNCYVTSEAVYHLLGGKDAGWVPQFLSHEGKTHWYLRHHDGLILDLTCSQFMTPVPYERGKGIGFMTREPSRRGRELMEVLVWQH